MIKFILPLLLLASFSFAQQQNNAVISANCIDLADSQLCEAGTAGAQSAAINTIIKASRTSCASPCTVVFSSDGTTAAGVDEYDVWRTFSYYWDFDTGVGSNHASLYNQSYRHVSGDTSFEAGHVPMPPPDGIESLIGPHYGVDAG